MPSRNPETFPPVTMGHIRSHGVTPLLVYCDSIGCNHSATVDADALPDDVPLRSLCPRMACTHCGLIGADVRPDWSQTEVRQSPQVRGVPGGESRRHHCPVTGRSRYFRAFS
jgi:hypothetical protein